MRQADERNAEMLKKEKKYKISFVNFDSQSDDYPNTKSVFHVELSQTACIREQVIRSFLYQHLTEQHLIYNIIIYLIMYV